MMRTGVPALRDLSGLPLAGFGIGASSVFQALGYSVYSMIISLIRQLVVLIPCAYVIGRVTGDVTGVWWAFVIAELVSLMVSALYLRRVNRDVIPHPLIYISCKWLFFAPSFRLDSLAASKYLRARPIEARQNKNLMPLLAF